jgi:hypothetical protein
MFGPKLASALHVLWKLARLVIVLCLFLSKIDPVASRCGLETRT